ncbi:MAG: hypothetical protein CMM76_05820 [Rhodospirillaceae bacterium]|nr:hypothetical protein [Rhodospirillaceae bacterium]
MRNIIIYRCILEVVRAGSVRKAAERLAITPSSLNRRIQSFEQEMGGPIFEKNAQGVRLNAAGELAVHAFKKHLAEIEVLKAQIEDLRGIRRGTVSITCSQPLLPHFLPRQILKYQKQFPGVDFSVSVADPEESEVALLNYEADLAITFSPLPTESFETVARLEQSIFAIISSVHPLTQHERLNLTQCVEFPLALHDSSFSIGKILDSQAQLSRLSLRPYLKSNSFILLQNYILNSDAVGFEIEIGLSENDPHGLVRRPLILNAPRKMSVQLIKLRGRNLSVAAAKFVEQVASAFNLDACDSINHLPGK